MRHVVHPIHDALDQTLARVPDLAPKTDRPVVETPRVPGGVAGCPGACAGLGSARALAAPWPVDQGLSVGRYSAARSSSPTSQKRASVASP